MQFTRVLAAVAASVAVAVVAPATGAFAQVTRQAAGLPYTDPNQIGLLTLCGTNLQPITSGSVTAKPFVWRVVSSAPAAKGYFIKGAKAQMFAYQPRPYTPAGAWSGMVMAAATLYSNPAHPMAQFTPIDEPLKDMIESFPPIWHHLYELRLYLGAPGLPEYTSQYAAADIAVHGSTWSLVSGGHASCTSGRAEAVEVLVGMPGARGTPKPTPSGTASASPTPSASGSPAPGSPGPGGVAPVADSRSSNPAAIAIALGVVALVVLVMGAGGLWWRRRRRATG